MKAKLINHNRKKSELTPLTIVMLVILCLFTLILFGLLFWGIMSAFKGNDEWRGNMGVIENKARFPKVWINPDTGKLCIVDNIQVVFNRSQIVLDNNEEINMGTMLLNTILYCVGCCVAQTIVPFVTSYLCAKYDNPVSKLMVAVNIATMAIPVVGSEPAAIRLAYNLGLYNHIWGLWIMKANYLGVYFLVFYAAFKAQPKAYHEAAMIDGASDLNIMLKISMPLCLGEFFTVMLVHFIQFWNDYQTPMLYMPLKPTIAYNTYNFISLSYSDVTAPVVITCSIMVLIPVLVLFLVFQKRLLKNLNVGGIKG